MSATDGTRPDPAPAGRLLTLIVGPPAAGGTFVARHEGRVVFVRGAAPGETVTVRLLDDPRAAAKARFWRAETLEVLEPSVDRVPSVWPEAGTDGVGTAEWAHIALPAQRRIASEVMQDLLRRARVTSFPVGEVSVEPALHDVDGLGWRTRERFAVDASGRVGMRGWRSHEVRPVGRNPLAVDAIRDLGLGEWTAPAGTEALDVAAPGTGPVSVVLLGRGLDPEQIEIPAAWGDAHVAVQNASGLHALRGDGVLHERVGDRDFAVAATGFWQVHREAAGVLSQIVLSELGARAGETVWDLYGGVGLFAAMIAPAVGEGGRVVSVEGVARATELARQNLADLSQASAECSDAMGWVRAQREKPDRVVVDPPRAGVGQDLMELLCEVTAERIVYVSCEPSTLARDLATAERCGWEIEDLRALDLFPHTHHVESVTVLRRTGA